MPAKLYTLDACEKLIDSYVNALGGRMVTLTDGVLGLGTVLLTGADGMKSVLIREVYLNEWSSAHTVRRYNKLPKKYALYV